ncbi:aspartyl-phosphate phosphatase Spo0E family protein [Priestia megaterium]|jgi:hypothetical protein|uniref:aspartyl-phosphate phosphatase Spo0E family protein n=1 Tax=Priestia megaterium TaxID=1404 RepID=UPI002E1A84B9|nr:aspartyl-phosphate phosphatase Spo0E family protein [Priestia megaterium]MED4295134.1 aspartyl-phosphate phosphatase Spo0E family protein [Priestia megaterium]
MFTVIQPLLAIDQQKHIENCIESKRQEMVNLAITYGLLDHKTIKCSQDLDELINSFIENQEKSLLFN